MEVVDVKSLPKESEKDLKKEARLILLNSFRASEFYDLVMETIDSALSHSDVIALLQKTGGGSDAEVGQLTKVEWMANGKIEKYIKNVLKRQ